MTFNWFTFFAQIVNFVILIALLYRFLYGPILRAMAEREEKLAARFREAEAAQERAEAEGERFNELRVELDAARQQLQDDAAAEAADMRKRLLAEARDEVDALSTRWFAGVEREKTTFLQAIRERIGEEVVDVARRTLADLGDVRLEAQIAAEFTRRLLNLSAQDRRALIVSGGGFEEDVIIRSTFPLPDETRQQLIQALQQLLMMEEGTDGSMRYSRVEEIGVRFEQTADLICGVELVVHDRRIAWSVEDYLAALEEDLLDAAEMEAEYA
jgi:F-type H+-transporting ATPase subunit b